MALDQYQQKAADFRKGNGAVSAAAGSGKTTVLVARALALIEEGVKPEAIKMLSFNTSAAAVGASRINQKLTGDANPKAMPGAQLSRTFHSFGLALMKLAWSGRGLNPADFPRTLGDTSSEGGGSYDPLDEVARQQSGGDLKPWDLYNACNAEVQAPARSPMAKPVTGYERVFNIPDLKEIVDLEAQLREALFEYGWPDKALKSDPQQVAKLLAKVRGVDLFDDGDEEARKTRAVADLMVRFEKKKNEVRRIDFADMVITAGDLIRRQDPYVMRALASIQHLQVDESQDSNYLRWYITRAVSTTAVSVLTVGDLRQSIQSFAGAKPALFEEWWNECDKANRFNMPTNYRSARAIIEAGNAVAKGEAWNLTGDSIQGNTALGKGRVIVEALMDAQIAQIAKELIDRNEAAPASEKVRPRDLLTVLCRNRAGLVGALQSLRDAGIRARIRKGGSIWKSGLGAELLAYLWFAQGQLPRDDAKRFAGQIKRIMNRPLRYINGDSMRQIVSERGLDMRAMRDMADRYDRNPVGFARSQERNVSRLYDDFLHLQKAASFADRVERVRELLLEALREDHQNDRTKPDPDEQNSGIVSTLDTLCNTAAQARDVTHLQEIIRQQSADDFAADPTGQIVEMDTIHGSKGGQWGTVFVIGVTEGVFPSKRAEGATEYDEEVRLLYVAVTRPIHTLYLGVGEIARFGEKIAGIEAAAQKWNEKKQEGKATTVAPDPLTAAAGSSVTTPVTVPGLQTVANVLAMVTPTKVRAEQLSMAAPKAGAGKAVTVRFSEFEELLAPMGFVEDFGRGAQTGQRVLALPMAEGFTVFVYTSVPPGQDASRGVGADSIKVALVKGAAGVGSFPIVQRTRNWRNAVVDRIGTALTQALSA